MRRKAVAVIAKTLRQNPKAPELLTSAADVALKLAQVEGNGSESFKADHASSIQDIKFVLRDCFDGVMCASSCAFLAQLQQLLSRDGPAATGEALSCSKVDCWNLEELQEKLMIIGRLGERQRLRCERFPQIIELRKNMIEMCRTRRFGALPADCADHLLKAVCCEDLEDEMGSAGLASKVNSTITPALGEQWKDRAWGNCLRHEVPSACGAALLGCMFVVLQDM